MPLCACLCPYAYALVKTRFKRLRAFPVGLEVTLPNIHDSGPTSAFLLRKRKTNQKIKRGSRFSIPRFGWHVTQARNHAHRNSSNLVPVFLSSKEVRRVGGSSSYRQLLLICIKYSSPSVTFVVRLSISPFAFFFAHFVRFKFLLWSGDSKATVDSASLDKAPPDPVHTRDCQALYKQ